MELIVKLEEFVAEFAEELWALLVKFAEDEELINKTLESWRCLNFEAEALTRDKDFRATSHAGKFIRKVIRIVLASELEALII